MTRRQRERELDEEIQAHLRLAAQDRVRNGETPEQAAIAARREFGNRTLIKEVARDLWGWTWVERFIAALHSAWRSLSRTPGSTATMILTLALGIGASTTIFSVVDAVLLRPLPYQDAGRLVAIWDREVHTRGTSKLAAPYSDFDAYLHNSRSFEQIAAVTWGVDSKILTGRGEARSVRANPSTLDFFSLLGVSAAFGRTFVQQDLNRGCTVVLAHSFWRSALGGQPGIVGQRLDLDQESCTVVGVMPSGFAFYAESTPMWMLLTTNNAIVREPDHHSVATFARLKPGISITAAQEELRRLHRFAHEHDAHGAEMEPSVYPLQEELTGRDLRLTLLLLFAGVNLVLMIACFNVANLLLGRFVARGRELAVRTALGSSRLGLLLLLLTESLLVAFSASVPGIALAAAALRYFRFANPIDLPPGITVGLDVHVLAFTVALAFLTTLISGLVPAWRASSTNLNDALKTAGRTSSLDVGRSRISKSLVVAEVTLSLLLLAGAGLMIESVLRFGSEPLGLSPAGLMTIGIGLPAAAHADDVRRLHFYEKVLGEVKSIPGVQAAAVSWELPVRSVQGITELSIDGRPKEHPGSIVPDVGLNAISPEYFPVTGIHIERGRNFGLFDREHSEPAAIVNEALVRKFFPNEDPVGKRVRIGAQKTNPWLTIVGVVGNERRSTAYEEMVWVDPPTLYRPLTQSVFDSVNLIFRCEDAQRAVVATEVRKRLTILDPGSPVGEIDTVQHLLAGYLAYPQFRAQLLTGFAGLALLLAVVGLYGVLAQTVTHRTREIGIRMALGAKRDEVRRMVAKEAMFLTGTGIALGLIAVWALTRFLKALLYGVSATDPATLAWVILALIVAAVVAACLPVQRATRVDPIVSLRYE